ncbi:MAG: hypothetical protein AB7S38_42110, partial [Vulcanimicrobiota bacterium]
PQAPPQAPPQQPPFQQPQIQELTTLSGLSRMSDGYNTAVNLPNGMNLTIRPEGAYAIDYRSAVAGTPSPPNANQGLPVQTSTRQRPGGPPEMVYNFQDLNGNHYTVFSESGDFIVESPDRRVGQVVLPNGNILTAVRGNQGTYSAQTYPNGQTVTSPGVGFNPMMGDRLFLPPGEPQVVALPYPIPRDYQMITSTNFGAAQLPASGVIPPAFEGARQNPLFPGRPVPQQGMRPGVWDRFKNWMSDTFGGGQPTPPPMPNRSFGPPRQANPYQSPYPPSAPPAQYHVPPTPAPPPTPPTFRDPAPPAQEPYLATPTPAAPQPFRPATPPPLPTTPPAIPTMAPTPPQAAPTPPQAPVQPAPQPPADELSTPTPAPLPDAGAEVNAAEAQQQMPPEVAALQASLVSFYQAVDKAGLSEQDQAAIGQEVGKRVQAFAQNGPALPEAMMSDVVEIIKARTVADFAKGKPELAQVVSTSQAFQDGYKALVPMLGGDLVEVVAQAEAKGAPAAG